MRTSPEAGSGRRWTLLAVFLALAASAFLILAPTMAEQSASTSVSTSGVHVERSDVMHRTLVDVEGPSIFIPLGIPVGIACLAFGFGLTRLARRFALISATLLWIFTVLGAMSIGFMYVPAAAALSMASHRFRRSTVTRLAAASALR